MCSTWFLDDSGSRGTANKCSKFRIWGLQPHIRRERERESERETNIGNVAALSAQAFQPAVMKSRLESVGLLKVEHVKEDMAIIL